MYLYMDFKKTRDDAAYMSIKCMKALDSDVLRSLAIRYRVFTANMSQCE